jgi:hypothetical protein
MSTREYLVKELSKILKELPDEQKAELLVDGVGVLAGGFLSLLSGIGQAAGVLVNAGIPKGVPVSKPEAPGGESDGPGKNSAA